MIANNREFCLAKALLFLVCWAAWGFSLGGAQELHEPATIADSSSEQLSHSSSKSLAVDDAYVPAWHAMFTRVPGDWGRLVGNNFRLDKIPAILALGAITGALMITDDETWRATHDFYRGNPSARHASDFFVELGDGRTHLGLAGVFAIFGFAADDKRALRTGSQIVEAFLATGTTVQLLKHITGRERPERQTRARGHWDLLPNQKAYHQDIPKYDAFPSGHVSTTFATLTVIAENYPELGWFTPVSYVVTALVGIGLAGKGWHWYSDYPLALALGYQYGMIAAHPEGVNLSNDGDPNAARLRINPMLVADGAGLSVEIDF